MTYARHDEVSVEVNAAPEALFDHLDDQERLAGHMNKPSMMMMGGRMFYEFDAAKGRATGSVIRMGGSFLWLKLLVEEVVTGHEAPRRKLWETRGRPALVIIGSYRMGFEITPVGSASRLRVFIDYDLPPGFLGGILGALLARFYARWCVSRMAADAQHRFVPAAPVVRAAI
ncbi:MAG: SRPBCC family protein [Proteobacteria bacterium]|nr:SRPBCC family protein [Pseudomonadota bacterium]